MQALRTLIWVVLVASATVCHAQDFFEDINAGGSPIMRSPCNAGLLTPRLTPTDGSIKINFFQMHKDITECPEEVAKLRGPINFGPNESTPPPKTGSFTRSGFGFNLKAKASNGIGSVFKGGNFANGLTLGAYKAFVKVDKVATKQPTSTFTADIFSLNISANSYRFYEADNDVDNQLTDFKSYVGFSLAYSFLKKVSLGKTNSDNLFLGGSVSLSRSDNYSDLQKVEVKNISTDKTTNGPRTTTTIDDDGYIYALTNSASTFKRPYYAQIRAHATLIPAVLKHRVAFIFYPELKYEIDAKAKVNANLAIHLLKDGEPSSSIFGIFWGFSDIGNSAKKESPFVKRSMVFGVTTAWDILLGKVK